MSPGSTCTRSWTAATPRPPTVIDLHRGPGGLPGRRGRSGASPPSRAATTPWTATQRWERTERPTTRWSHGEGPRAQSAARGRSRGSYDEGRHRRVRPAHGHHRRPGVARPDGDTVIFFNFRPDRARELTRALTEPELRRFRLGRRPRRGHLRQSDRVRRHLHDRRSPSPRTSRATCWPRSLGDGRSDRSCTSPRPRSTPTSRSSSTGGASEPFPGERRCLVPSPTDVATYDEKPEMSCHQVAARVRARSWTEESIDFVVLNFANPDMVGHTGVLSATIAALEHVDGCLGAGARGACGPATPTSSSRPTTATPSRCWPPTAARTPPTPPTRCRFVLPRGGAVPPRGRRTGRHRPDRSSACSGWTLPRR